MGEGQHTQMGAAPRSISQIRRDLVLAEEDGDEARVSALRQEIRDAADQARHLDGGKRAAAS